MLDVVQLGKAIRFAFVAIVVGLSYPTIRSTLAIDSFMRIYMDMLNGRPLPALTTLMIQFRWVLNLISFLVPVAAMATLLDRQLPRSFYVLGAIGFIAILQAVVLYTALFAPFSAIMRAMSNP